MCLSAGANREDRWRYIEALLQRWLPADPQEFVEARIPEPLRTQMRTPTCDDSLDPQQLRLAEARMNIAIPTAMREFYERFSKWTPFWSLNELLQPPSRLDCEGDRLVFLVENQVVADWGVSVLDGGEDPPVTFRWIGPLPKLESEGSFSEFMVGFTVHHLVFAPDFIANGRVDHEQVRIIEMQLLRLPIAEWHWPDFPTRFYVGDDLVAEIDGMNSYPYWLWLAARTPRAFGKIDELLIASGMQWEYRWRDS